MASVNWTELVDANARAYGEIVAGIDPHLPDIPQAFEQGDDRDSWLMRYLDFVLDTVAGQVGFVKFQSAFFEAYGLGGLAALSRAIKRAKGAGMGVILDAKRGDIGSTAAAYARAYLTPAEEGGSGDFEVDCLTVNPLMGPDTLEPFLACVRRYGKGLLVLCRTSNPGAAWLQDRTIGNRAVADHLAELIAGYGEAAGTALSPVGAVIGATLPHEGRRLRQLLQRAIILAPGLGPQGGDPATLQSLRGTQVGDLLIPISRGLLRAEDRAIALADYRQLIVDRLADFRMQTRPDRRLRAAG